MKGMVMLVPVTGATVELAMYWMTAGLFNHPREVWN
jgi:hypothetical protein